MTPDGSVTLRFQLFVLIKHLYRSRALPYQQCNVRTIIFVLCASRHPSLHMKNKNEQTKKGLKLFIESWCGNSYRLYP